MWSLSHWTTREVPTLLIKNFNYKSNAHGRVYKVTETFKGKVKALFCPQFLQSLGREVNSVSCTFKNENIQSSEICILVYYIEDSFLYQDNFLCQYTTIKSFVFFFVVITNNFEVYNFKH